MAYAAQRNSADRTKTVVVVTLVEAAVVYAVVTGLTMTGTINPETIFRAHNVPLPPPETVKPPKADPQPDHRTAHVRTVTPPPNGLNTLTTNGSDVIIDRGTDIIIEPSPPPEFKRELHLASITPARPRGHPGEWVTPNDYPSQDLREGNQGTVRFRLEIAANGRVTGCTVTQSSGFPRLDAAACARLTSRARFDPAKDESGASQPGSYASSVRWTIPQD